MRFKRARVHRSSSSSILGRTLFRDSNSAWYFCFNTDVDALVFSAFVVVVVDAVVVVVVVVVRSLISSSRRVSREVWFFLVKTRPDVDSSRLST